jgi:ornithine carbamoyltransferase
MADALTIQEEFGSLKGVNVAFVGDGNNVATSLLHICAKLGAKFQHSIAESL